MENAHIIEIEHLKKSFGDVKAVNDLSFNVRQGELFAFLGVNGAGKSTTISIICGQLDKDAGNVTVCGESIEHGLDKIARRLGVVFQNSVLDQALSVRDNLRSRAALYGINGADFKKRLAELAELLDFGDLLGRTVGKLSGGQRRRKNPPYFRAGASRFHYSGARHGGEYPDRRSHKENNPRPQSAGI